MASVQPDVERTPSPPEAPLPPGAERESFLPQADTEQAPGDDVIWRALLWSLAAAAAVGVLIFFAWLILAPVESTTPPDLVFPMLAIRDVQIEPSQVPELPFVDAAGEAGIHFTHFDGRTGLLLMPETVGSGCAFFDYDNDGKQDLLLVNGSYLPGHDKPASPKNSEGRNPSAAQPTMALYHNEGGGRFRDVTSGSGLEVSMYGMGVACGDFDGDGMTDVFVTALGPNRLFRNLGGGRFADVTQKAGVAGEPNRWSTSAGFFDYNNDDRLDLFVCNYVDWSEQMDQKISYSPNGIRNYMPPWFCNGTHNYLYRGNGDGTFTDVSREAGIEVMNPASNVPKGKGLGVVFCDLDEDGWLDVIVANDLVQGFLFHNQRNGTFREIGEAAGLGNGQNGEPVAGMGVDVGHLYEDGRVTVGMANLSGKITAMFASQQNPLSYVDEVLSLGIAAETQRSTSWGLFFFDCDLDGRLDMFQCCGSISCEPCTKVMHEDYLQPSKLFWNCGPDRPIRLAVLPKEKRSAVLDRPLMARGAAYGDFDGDGDQDILINQNGRPALLLRNDQRLENNWIRLKLVGEGGNREAIGARVEVRVGGQLLRRRVLPTRSYLSQVELPVTIGLGKHTRPDEVRIIWPDSTSQVVPDVKRNGLTTIKKPPRQSGT
jgi:hypothetical protein